MSGLTASRQKVKSSYDRMSKWYDLFTWGEKKHVQAGLEMLDAREGERVLEPGFGTGRGILSLARSVGPAGKVYGLDISDGMVKITRKKLERAGLAGRVELWCGDAVDIPLEDESCNAVFASFTLELFREEEIPEVLSQCRRVLRRGGRISVVSMSSRGPEGMMVRLYGWAHRKFPDYVDCRPIQAGAYMEDSGFKIVNRREASEFGLPVDIILAVKGNDTVAKPRGQ
jgi:ubiquinone/menaquinone biosynthesis C-methylase UbiE